jgi:hypothetical protein
MQLQSTTPHPTMTQYSLKKGLKKFKGVGKGSEELMYVCPWFWGLTSWISWNGGSPYLLRPTDIQKDALGPPCRLEKDPLRGYQKAKHQHEKLHGIRDSWRGRRRPKNAMDRIIFEAQGYKVDESTLNQDNLSSMLLETNGKGSSSKRTKHINVWYFFIKDKIGSGEITVKHFPTGERLRDHFIKAVQGSQFKYFRAEIQGI